MMRIVRAAGVVLWMVGALLVVVMVATFAPTFFGLQTMIVSSGSMGRTMPIGSVALTRDVDAHSIGVGDVISYRHREVGETTTHRVIAVEVTGSQVFFTTKGDANASADPEPVVVDSRIHRVEHVVPGVGYVVRYARTPLGALGLIVLPLLGLLLDKGTRSRRKSLRPIEAGWSATTYELLNVAPDSMRKTATG